MYTSWNIGRLKLERDSGILYINHHILLTHFMHSLFSKIFSWNIWLTAMHPDQDLWNKFFSTTDNLHILNNLQSNVLNYVYHVGSSCLKNISGSTLTIPSMKKNDIQWLVCTGYLSNLIFNLTTYAFSSNIKRSSQNYNNLNR